MPKSGMTSLADQPNRKVPVVSRQNPPSCEITPEFLSDGEFRFLLKIVPLPQLCRFQHPPEHRFSHAPHQLISSTVDLGTQITSMMAALKGSSKFKHLPRAASGPLKCPLEGASLLASSHFNKGSAFPKDERTAFKLHGHLPPNVQTLDEQVQRAYEQYRSRDNDLAKNTFMASM
jgi:hypothetical protein